MFVAIGDQKDRLIVPISDGVCGRKADEIRARRSFVHSYPSSQITPGTDGDPPDADIDSPPRYVRPATKAPRRRVPARNTHAPGCGGIERAACVFVDGRL